jgi:hypothetical protein
LERYAACAKADMSGADAIGAEAIGVDEKHFGRNRVVTVVHDDSVASRGRVLHTSEGCKAQNVGLFVQTLKVHGGDPEKIDRCSPD